MKSSIEKQLDLLDQGIVNIPELKKVLLVCLQTSTSKLSMSDIIPIEDYGTDNRITRIVNIFKAKGWIDMHPWEFVHTIKVFDIKHQCNNLGAKCINYLKELLKEKGYEWK